MKIPPILEIGGVLISSDILTECFCCDYEKCKGICCVEGTAGAPVTMDEIAAMEDRYADEEGDMVTSIVRGKECVFAKENDGCWLCMLEKQYREKNPSFSHSLNFSFSHSLNFSKPISCALYPIREKNFGNGLIGLNYHRWDICREGREKGKALGLPVYQFLKEPLIRRFGQQWYDELCDVAQQLLEP